jgi:hypothetical protein
MKDVCEFCSDKECDGIQTWGSDPYASEINGDDTDYFMCEGQRWESAQEI